MSLRYPAYPNIPAPGPSPLASLAEGFGQGFGQAREERRATDAKRTAGAIVERNLAHQAGQGSSLSTLGSLFSQGAFGAAPATAAPHTAATSGGGKSQGLATKGEIYEPFMAAVRTGITNPFGLAAVAATGNAESSFSPGNAFRQWSDPSESGAPGQAGGVLSWRAERLDAMRNFARSRGDDPSRPSPETQGLFFLSEDPQLVARLNSAQSPEEAIGLMNNAWRFAGYDRPGGEATRRTNMARMYAGRFRREAPVEVASLDPSAGMGSALAYTGGGSPRSSSSPTIIPNAAASTGSSRNGAAAPAMPPALLDQASSAPAPATRVAQAQPPIGGNIGAIIQGIAGGYSAPPPVSSAEFQALVSSPVTRPLAEQIWRTAQGDPEAPERMFRTAMELEGLIYDRQQDAYEREQSAFGAVPAGYRRTADGQGLEFIPGGPQDPTRTSFTPDLESIYTEDGREQKGYFQNGTWVNVGGAKAPGASNGATTLYPDGRIEIGGGGVRVPSGFMPDPNTPGAVVPIPGGPADQLPAELSGRIAIADSFLGQVPELEREIREGGVTGLWDRLQAGVNSSSPQASIYRKLQSGADALQRLLTGAGMTENEAAIYAQRYLPTYTDNAASALDKLGQMQREVENARAAALRGRGGINSNATPNGAPEGAGNGVDYKTRYGLE